MQIGEFLEYVWWMCGFVLTFDLVIFSYYIIKKLCIHNKEEINSWKFWLKFNYIKDVLYRKLLLCQIMFSQDFFFGIWELSLILIFENSTILFSLFLLLLLWCLTTRTNTRKSKKQRNHHSLRIKYNWENNLLR